MGKKRICLDPGHYGEKYNAGVVSGYYESATVWKLTQYEKEYLEQMGIEVLVTRSNINENPDLTARGKMAAGCDLFVSNHTNACGTKKIGKNNPKAAEIEADNMERVRWNQTVDRALISRVAKERMS